MTMFYILPPHRQGILAPVAGAFVVSPFPVGTEKDACPLPLRLRSQSTAGLRLDTPVFFAPSANISQIPEACECRKLQRVPF